jgi:hypothetical protein
MLFGIFRMRGVNVQSKWESNWRPDLTMSSNVRRNCLACLPCGKDLNPMGFKHPRMRIARIYQQKICPIYVCKFEPIQTYHQPLSELTFRLALDFIIAVSTRLSGFPEL